MTVHHLGVYNYIQHLLLLSTDHFHFASNIQFCYLSQVKKKLIFNHNLFSLMI